MCVQIIPIEGWGISMIKAGAMALAIPITIWRTPFMSKATILGGLLVGSVLLSATVINSDFRSSTLYYFALFVIMFNMYYGLIVKGTFTIDYYIKLLRGLLLAYIICLGVQQLTSVVGFGTIPLLNKFFLSTERGILTGNSLSLEPSHSARIIAIAFYAFLKVNEIKKGAPLSIKQLFVENKWLTFGFFWAMTTMGSGTAYVSLGILSLYFIRKEYIMFIIPTALVLYFAIPSIDNFSLNRARATIETTFTGDAEKVMKTDGSAAARISPMLNTFNNFDILSVKTWFGRGTSKVGEKWNPYSKENGMWSQYGLLAYILGFFLIYTCCVTRLFSIETLLIFILVGFSTSNITYIWGCYMILIPVKYFYFSHENT